VHETNVFPSIQNHSSNYLFLTFVSSVLLFSAQGDWPEPRVYKEEWQRSNEGDVLDGRSRWWRLDAWDEDMVSITEQHQ
jgi:hypothetical protein